MKKFIIGFAFTYIGILFIMDVGAALGIDIGIARAMGDES